MPRLLAAALLACLLARAPGPGGALATPAGRRTPDAGRAAPPCSCKPLPLARIAILRKEEAGPGIHELEGVVETCGCEGTEARWTLPRGCSRLAGPRACDLPGSPSLTRMGMCAYGDEGEIRLEIIGKDGEVLVTASYDLASPPPAPGRVRYETETGTGRRVKVYE
ncbi:MAG: hypothetical protein HY608_11910 [Planctomycetes bacterium]|nr:hypothetical protein [Planctomycetota bacterium]